MDFNAWLMGHSLVSDQVDRRELAVILRELERVLAGTVPGALVELGCYEGTTALWLQRLLDHHHEDRELHVYDSFAGLPPKQAPDNSPAGEQFKAGELLASKAVLIRHFKQAGLRLPIIHKGWFGELGDKDVPSPIAFAFLDGDFYQSIHDSLQLIWPRLSPGAIVVIDDYQTEALPGVRRATDQFLLPLPHSLRVEASLAIIRT